MASGGYDGSIRIQAIVDDSKAGKWLEALRKDLLRQTEQVDKQAQAVQKLREQYKKLKSSGQTTKQTKEIEKLTEEVRNAESEIARLDQKRRELEGIGARIAPAFGGEYSPNIKKELDEVAKSIQKINSSVAPARARLEELRVPPGSSEEGIKLAESIKAAEEKLEIFKQHSADTAEKVKEASAEVEGEKQRLQEMAESAQVTDQHIAGLNEELSKLKQRQAELESLGIGLGYTEYDDVTQKIFSVNEELKSYRDNLRNTQPEEQETAAWTEKLKDAMSRLGAGVVGAGKRAASAIGWLKDRVKGLGREKGFDKAGQSAAKFGRRLKSIVAGALFFNIISSGLRELTDQIGKYLTANRDFSTALSKIKSNLLTAFQPIYDTVLPALNALMETLSQVTAQIAAFMARIFGTTADKAQENAEALYEQANATEEAGESAKEAEKFLASFDTIESVGSEKAETSAKEQEELTTPQFDTDFSEIQSPEWLTDFWKPFEESWEQYGVSTLEAFQSALELIGDVVAAIGAAFMNIWTGGEGLTFLNNIQLLLQMVLGIIGDIATAFIAAWNSGAGEAVIGAIFYALNSVFSLILSIGLAFREAWNSGIGVEICNTILSIITNIFIIIGNLANRLREAWEANNNGIKIWSAILEIIKVVLEFLEEITVATLEWSENLDLTPLMSSLVQLLESLAPLLQTIAELVSDFWGNTVLPFLTWVIEEGLPAVISSLSELFYYLADSPDLIVALTELVVAFVAAWKLASAIEAISKLKAETLLLTAILGIFLTLVFDIANAWNDMTGLEKAVSVLGLLAAAAAVAAIAIGALQSALTLGVAAIAIAAGITAITLAVNSATKRANSAASTKSFSGTASEFSTTDLPHLANGAVISPNSEFLAILGDQRSGTNVETPLSTMKQAFLEALSESGVFQMGASSSGDHTTILQIGEQEFGRLVYKLNNQQTQRVGVRLAGV